MISRQRRPPKAILHHSVHSQHPPFSTHALQQLLDTSKDVLTKKRTVNLYLPSFLVKKMKTDANNISGTSTSKLLRYPIDFTISNLAGHGSFLCLALSYMEKDFLSLRMYAFSGISLSIIFQYYREKPLWIPIRWNSLFLVINAVMIILLLKEQDEARNIPEEQKLLFRNVFEKKGMNSIDFLHLISAAKRLELKKGETVIESGKKNKTVYLVKEGSLSVRKPKTRQLIAVIDRHQFIGEMSFLNWSNTLTMMESLQKQQAEAISTAYDDASTDSQGQMKELSKSLGKFIGIIQQTADSPSREGTERKKQNVMEEGFAVQADVVCEENSVVFAWTFQDLHRLMHQYPSLGFVFERCLSNDLHQKMSYRSQTSSSPEKNSESSGEQREDSSLIWEEDMRLRYKQILHGGLMDGEVTAMEKQILQQFRDKYQISLLEHNQLLIDLNWTPEDYERGHKLDSRPTEQAQAASEGSVAYMKLFKSVLEKGKITIEERERLRRSRMENQISTEEQCQMLVDLGWSFDEYEVGEKKM